jgi:hypothetical protein
VTFDTPLSLVGPLRKPRQMLGDQEYGGHASIHDDEMAEKLGFRAGPIEGPTHFSLFPPLLEKIWGRAWFEQGCISSHYLNMVVEGEEVRAFAEIPAEGANSTRVWAEKADGTPVLEASASLGQHAGPTLLEQRMAALRPPGRLLILEDLHVGMTGVADERVRMDPDQHMGNLYPFSLNQKLAAITEPVRVSRSKTGNVLHLRAPSAAAPIIQHSKDHILERVNLASGSKIKSLKIIQTAPPKQLNLIIPRPLTPQQREALVKAVAPVRTPGLRTALASLGEAILTGVRKG